MGRVYIWICLALALLLTAPEAIAVEPDEILKDQALEKRARAISLNLRCLVCQNQSIDDSNAGLAKDLRILVRQRLTKGETDEQVMDFIEARYGEFVLLKPRFALHTLILWLAAPLLLLFTIFSMFKSSRRRKAEMQSASARKLTAAEKRELKKLLKEA
jgi:cytochrome c-type biogenesis protein CcmH